MTTRYKLLLILIGMIGSPIALSCFNVGDLILFFGTIFIELILGSWGVCILADKANEHFDH